jgi:hypothetical protein
MLPQHLDAIADPAARNAQAGREALREVARHPARALVVGAVRWVRLVSLNPGRIEHDALVRAGWPSALVLLWLGLEWTLLVAGCAVAWRAGAATRPAVSFAVLLAAPYVLVVTVTFVQTRFRLPLVLLLAPFSAAGLSRFLETPRSSGGRRALVLAALGGVALVVAATAVDLALKRL